MIWELEMALRERSCNPEELVVQAANLVGEIAYKYSHHYYQHSLAASYQAASGFWSILAICEMSKVITDTCQTNFLGCFECILRIK